MVERIVGMHIIGIGSAEILQGFGVAVKMGATKADFGESLSMIIKTNNRFMRCYSSYKRRRISYNALIHSLFDDLHSIEFCNANSSLSRSMCSPGYLNF